MSTLRSIYRAVFPSDCILCRTNAIVGEETVCDGCKAKLEEMLNEPCRHCGLPASQCICRENQFVHALFWYRLQKVRGLLYMVKHRADKEQIAFLATLLASLCTERYDAVTYVPRSDVNRRKNGFDQSRLLAKEIAEILHLPLVETLHCTNAKEQKFLSASERLKFIQTKFEVLPDAVTEYPRLLLVDDISTTGATLKACSSLLRKAGAKAVHRAVLAKTELELI